ncbi:MAG: electron transfer flavoprotein subunit alpha/FixB family protein [Deltaproteobacteria bacterium]|nr:electron transfer flavoprotein subunit alpha/FixB family protein [Deltaproteobacteria bacterium]
MGELIVVIEHSSGEVSDVSYQMLFKGSELSKSLSSGLTAVVIGGKDEPLVKDINERADRVIVIEDDSLNNFNGEVYAEILKRIVDEERPLMTLIGHTPWGMDIAPSLSIKTGYSLASDCIDIIMEASRPKVIRQIFGGKLLSRVALKESEGYIITIRASAFPGDKVEGYQGQIVKNQLPQGLAKPRKQFIEFVDSSAGEVDISQAELLISIGRGVGEADKVELIKDLAEKMGGTLSCSRPVVDKGWLPKYRQVGTSGKSVKPKVYLALGISGAFQHVAGITGAGTVIAVNKDKKAPIFRVADYGVIDDIFKITEAMKGML